MNAGLLLPDNQFLVFNNAGMILRLDYKTEKKIGEFSGTLNKREFGGLVHDLSNYWRSIISPKHIKYKNEQLLIGDKRLLKGKMGTKGVLWDLKTGRPTLELVGHEKGIICFDYNEEKDEIIYRFWRWTM